MTDKQIIIDGVDVSGCASYIDNGECISEIVYPDYCKACSNCTYKLEQKLKAKEQECEELKEQLKEMNEVIRTETTRCNLVNILKTELDQLKEQLEAYKMEAEEGKEINAELKAENEQLKRQHEGDKGLITSTGKMNYQLIQEYDKLKTALTEIKELLLKTPTDSQGHCVNAKSVILQKISEVEDEHNG